MANGWDGGTAAQEVGNLLVEPGEERVLAQNLGHRFDVVVSH